MSAQQLSSYTTIRHSLIVGPHFWCSGKILGLIRVLQNTYTMNEAIYRMREKKWKTLLSERKRGKSWRESETACWCYIITPSRRQNTTKTDQWPNIDLMTSYADCRSYRPRMHLVCTSYAPPIAAPMRRLTATAILTRRGICHSPAEGPGRSMFTFGMIFGLSGCCGPIRRGFERLVNQKAAQKYLDGNGLLWSRSHWRRTWTELLQVRSLWSKVRMLYKN